MSRFDYLVLPIFGIARPKDQFDKTKKEQQYQGWLSLGLKQANHLSVFTGELINNSRIWHHLDLVY
jgi:hypothetical protein